MRGITVPKAKSSQGKARVAAPYAQPNRPASRAVPGLSKGPSIAVVRKNTTVSADPNKRKTSVDWSAGADEPMTDLHRQMRDLKGFKQAVVMTAEKSGFVHNPVRQDMDEAWGRFEGQEQQ